jgi:hypothetical protein
MGRWGLLLLGLSVCSLAGCLVGKPITSASWLPRGWPVPGFENTDTVVLDVFLCEGSIASQSLGDALWQFADDQIGNLEQKALLEQNGFRVGQVGGVAPAGVQSLIASKRTCPDPRRIQQPCGKPKRLTLGPPVSWCRFQPHFEERSDAVDIENADFALSVVASALPDGRTQLRFTPTVSHGDAAVMPTPTSDRTAWMFQKQQANETYPRLSWQVTLDANEHAIVGGRFDRPETLGFQSFIRATESPPRQRVLIIRVGRPNAGTATDGQIEPTEVQRDGAPPIALQAALTTFRGVAP